MNTGNDFEAVRRSISALEQRKQDMEKDIRRLKRHGACFAVPDWRSGQNGDYLYLMPTDESPPEYIGTEPEDQQHALAKIKRGQQVTTLRQQIASIDQEIADKHRLLEQLADTAQ